MLHVITLKFSYCCIFFQLGVHTRLKGFCFGVNQIGWSTVNSIPTLMFTYMPVWIIIFSLVNILPMEVSHANQVLET